jgi:hypothetical protein
MGISIREKYINHKNMALESISMGMEISLEDIGDMIKNKVKGNFGVNRKKVIVDIGIIINT